MLIVAKSINSKHVVYYKHHSSDTRRASIICIHGILAEASLFDNLSILSDRHIDVYAITLPGYGISKEDLASVNFDDVLYSLHDLVKSIPIPRFMLGFSVGTIYALYYAATYKDINGVILASSLFHPIDSRLPEYARELYVSYKKGVKEIDLSKYLKLPPSYEYINNNLCRNIYPLSYIADLFLRATNKDILKDTTLSTLILYGIDDIFTDNAQVVESYKLLSSNDKRLCIFNTDHWLFDTFSYNKISNTEVIDCIEEWIKQYCK